MMLSAKWNFRLDDTMAVSSPGEWGVGTHSPLLPLLPLPTPPTPHSTKYKYYNLGNKNRVTFCWQYLSKIFTNFKKPHEV